jgi:hypothetical protein
MKSWREIAFSIVSWLANVLDPPGRMSTDEKIAFSKALEEKQAAPAPPYVWIDPTVRQRGYEQSAWAEPERNTDKPAIIPNPHGRYFQERHREFLETREQPAIPKMTRKLNLVDPSEPLPGDTLYETPAFLTDRKIS